MTTVPDPLAGLSPHQRKMHDKRLRRVRLHELCNAPDRLARIRRRNTSLAMYDHKHTREISRRLRQEASKAAKAL